MNRKVIFEDVTPELPTERKKRRNKNQGKRIKGIGNAINDEISKNLFERYLKKHKIKYSLASSFKQFIKQFKSKQFRACFFSIDVNVSAKD